MNDPEGVEASLFGAETSGHVMLFDPSGHRRFHGGITASRGHAGENMGRQKIIAIVRGESTARDEFPVFGCRLRSSYAENVP
ncbi:MAG: hypothetical protein U0744_08910 [Gemmataceae bacterium]